MTDDDHCSHAFLEKLDRALAEVEGEPPWEDWHAALQQSVQQVESTEVEPECLMAIAPSEASDDEDVSLLVPR